jgi:glycosyltransferase involved in cell wall biosynthesis
MYNRERFIARAVSSCLKQDFRDFEIIVVDDGSTDGSVDVVKSLKDPRIELICHNFNRGVGPARNTGVDAATGEWVVFLDSDDELLPGSLSVIYKRSTEVDQNISRLQFMGRLDTGEVSPDPPLKNEFWDYVEYLTWMEVCNCRRQDTMPVVRRRTFKQVRFYDDRTLEGLYHLNFMKQFNARSLPDVVALYHQDAENQLTKPNMCRALQDAQNQALTGDLLLEKHGEALKQYAPRIYEKHISGLATLWFLSGNRMKGIKYSFSSLAHNWLSLRNWVILTTGLLGPKIIAWMKSFRSRLS